MTPSPAATSAGAGIGVGASTGVGGPAIPTAALSSNAKSHSHRSNSGQAMPQDTGGDSDSDIDSEGDCSVLGASVLDPNLHVILMTQTEAKENLSVMQDTHPAYVVLYDPDITLIRRVEAYQSTLPVGTALKVYFLLYGEGFIDLVFMCVPTTLTVFK